VVPVLERLLHKLPNTGVKRGLTTLSGDDTTFTEGAVEKLKVSLLEEGLSRTFRITGISDDDIELVLLVLEVFESITDENLNFRMIEALGHLGEVLLGETDNGLYLSMDVPY
jgi:hypothetical protein